MKRIRQRHARVLWNAKSSGSAMVLLTIPLDVCNWLVKGDVVNVELGGIIESPNSIEFNYRFSIKKKKSQ